MSPTLAESSRGIIETLKRRQECDRLAHELAWRMAVSAVESECLPVMDVDTGHEWMDLISQFEIDRVQQELRYIAMRGALRYHPQHPLWIQIGEPEELTR